MWNLTQCFLQNQQNNISNNVLKSKKTFQHKKYNISIATDVAPAMISKNH